jgi:hypothetical protein
MRTKVKTAVQSAPARNWATPRLEETDLQSQARDDAEQITATDIMVNISKLHAGSSYGIKNGGHESEMQGIERKKSMGITVWARTDSGNRGPGDTAETKGLNVCPA